MPGISLGRMRAMARKEAIQLRRDRRSLALAFVVPVLLLLFFGYAITWDVREIRLAVLNEDVGRRGAELVDAFVASRYFRVTEHLARYGDADRRLVGGDVAAVLVIPPTFSRDLAAGRGAAVQLLLDGSDANTATIALGYADAIVARYSSRVVLQGRSVAPAVSSAAPSPPAAAAVPVVPAVSSAAPPLPVATAAAPVATASVPAAAPPIAAGAPPVAAGAPPVTAETRVWYNPTLESRNMVVPGLIAVIMSIIAATLTSLTIAREWERGTMEQLASTPVHRLEVVFGKLLPYVAIGLFDVAVAVLAAVLVFDVPFRGSLLLLGAMSLLFLLGALGLGMFISAALKSQVLATQVSMVATYFPALILSGLIFDIASMPWALRLVSHVVPARYFVTVTRGVFLKGVGVEALWAQGLSMLVFAAVGIGLATASFEKRITR